METDIDFQTNKRSLNNVNVECEVPTGTMKRAKLSDVVVSSYVSEAVVGNDQPRQAL